MASKDKDAETEGFEPSIPFRGIHTFQACSFNHSDKSPRKDGKNTFFRQKLNIFFTLAVVTAITSCVVIFLISAIFEATYLI